MGMTHEEMIARAWARAQALQLTVYRVREDENGLYIPVQSQSRPMDHRVRVTAHGPTCDCEAMYYRKVPVCVHILTVCLRAMKAKKRGTRGLARALITLYGIPLDMTV
ncbi:MAG: hypothetical protein ACXWQ5_01040 [Ktedonobacterales bacterium]